MQHTKMMVLALTGVFLLACGKPAKPSGASSVDKPKTANQEQAAERVGGEDVALAGDLPQADAACRACRATYCTKYDGVVDLPALCFGNADASFREQCLAAKNCAYQKKCGYTAEGPMECFCGSADVPTCLKPGAANGPCQAEFLAAARTTSVTELSERFGDLSFPVAAASYFVSCDRDLCKMCRPQAN